MVSRILHHRISVKANIYSSGNCDSVTIIDPTCPMVAADLARRQTQRRATGEKTLERDDTFRTQTYLYGPDIVNLMNLRRSAAVWLPTQMGLCSQISVPTTVIAAGLLCTATFRLANAPALYSNMTMKAIRYKPTNSIMTLAGIFSSYSKLTSASTCSS